MCRNKTFVGDRLSLLVQRDVYMRDVVSTGPMASDVVWPLDGASVQTAILRFRTDMAYNMGLHLRDTSGCDLCCSQTNGSAIILQTSDGQRRRAEVVVDAMSATVLATIDLTGSGAGVRVTAVQHNWEEYPQCAIYNQALLPHLPVNIQRP
jgi:hypothetical protein